MRSIIAGDVYRIAFRGTGYELKGPHYGVVVSEGSFNDLSTVVVVPFSTGARPYSWRVPVQIQGTPTLALIDQIRVLDRSLLREPIGVLSNAALIEIRMRLAELLGFDRLPTF